MGQHYALPATAAPVPHRSSSDLRIAERRGAAVDKEVRVGIRGFQLAGRFGSLQDDLLCNGSDASPQVDLAGDKSQGLGCETGNDAPLDGDVAGRQSRAAGASR